MPTDPRSLATPELFARAALSPFEERLARSGCRTGLVMLVVTWVVILLFVPLSLPNRLVFCLLSALPLLAAVYRFVDFLSTVRVRGFLKEIDRRFGLREMPEYLRGYERQRQPDRLRILFLARDLPHGSHYWGHLILNAHGEPLVRSVIWRELDRDRTSIHSEFKNWKWHEVDTSGDPNPIDQFPLRKLDELRDTITQTKGSGVSRFPTTVRDGRPATAAVIFDDGSPTTIVSASLADSARELSIDHRRQLLEQIAQLFGSISFSASEESP